MPAMMSNPLCQPFEFWGDHAHGVLFIHGFTASPGTLYPLGKDISARTGFYVRSILLPGHGTTPEEMRRYNAEDWLRCAQAAFDQMRRECRVVSVIGLSMGGTLALRLAETRPVKKIVCIAAALSVYNRKSIFANWLWPFVPFIENKPGKEAENFLAEYNETYSRTPVRSVGELNKLMKITRRSLAGIHCPIMVVRAAKDETVRPESADWIMKGVSSSEPFLLELPQSPHVCTLGPEREQLGEKVANFLKA